MPFIDRTNLGIRATTSLAGWRYTLSPTYRLKVNEQMNRLSDADRMETHLTLVLNLVLSTAFAVLVLWLALGPLIAK